MEDSDSSVDLTTSDIEDSDALYEEINPSFEDKIGAFKTNNREDNRWQRRFIHTSPTKSQFSKTTETVLVVHGWDTPQEEQPMSLIILSVRLNVLGRKFRIKSARMWFAFDEDPKNPPDKKALPEVVAFAPYVQQEEGETMSRWKERATLAQLQGSRK